MNKPLIFIISIVCILSIEGCSAVFETNIEKRKVQLLAPADSLRTDIATHTFWWSYVDGADKYNLLIVSPTFNYTERLVVDTNLTGNKFSFALTPGNYEWSVSAYNSGYSTPYTVFTLIVDSTTELSHQQVILINPTQNGISGAALQKFQWYRIYSATSYRFEIRRNDWNGDLIDVPIVTTSDNISLMLVEGNYVWGVKAINSISSTPFTTQNLTIDMSSPAKPILISPQSGDTLKGVPVHLTWSHPDVNGSSISDSVLVSTDSVQFSGHVIKAFKTNSLWYDVSPGANGDYYWRIRSIDAAGNKSEYSEIWKFSLEL